MMSTRVGSRGSPKVSYSSSMPLARARAMVDGRGLWCAHGLSVNRNLERGPAGLGTGRGPLSPALPPAEQGEGRGNTLQALRTQSVERSSCPDPAAEQREDWRDASAVRRTRPVALVPTAWFSSLPPAPRGEGPGIGGRTLYPSHPSSALTDGSLGD